MTVFYRKYRPQNISELDSEQTRKRVAEILTSKKIPHAILLAGPRGLGKTSIARIIAKSVNCEKKAKDGEPCNQCFFCKSITNGSNVDVLEIDGASNRGIDEIRDLKEKIKLTPTSCQYKVYIIDEVHMLTTEAFNALLKTLEEPPEKTIFILCTTELNKVPETIISRCLKIPFSYPMLTEILVSLERAVKGEDIKASKEVLEMIAKEAKGSFRDAQKLLDQLTLTGNTITKEKVLEIIGKQVVIKGDEFLNYLIAFQTKEALEWLNDQVAQGMGIRQWNETLLDIFHQAMLLKSAQIKSERNDLDLEILQQLSVTEIIKLIDLFSKAYQETKSSYIPQLPLELAIVEWGETRLDQKSKIPLRPPALPPRGRRSEASKNQRLDEKPKNIEDKDQKIINENKEVIAEQVKGTEKTVTVFWPKILAAVKPVNHSIEALLRSSRPLLYEDDCLTIEVFYKFHKERLEEPKIFSILGKTISEVLGKNTKIKYILGEKKKVEKEDTAKALEEVFGK